MLHKNKKEIDRNTFPFSEEHLNKFREELEKEGTFENLMLKKQALKKEKGIKYISLYYDIEGYKKKYLTGVYANLHDFYDTEMPYVFWSYLYELLSKRDEEKE